MPKVYRVHISKNKETGNLEYYPMVEIDMSDEMYNQFKWDKVVRMDYIGNESIFMFHPDKFALECVGVGMTTEHTIRNRWDEIFSQEAKDSWQERLDSGEVGNIRFCQSEAENLLNQEN